MFLTRALGTINIFREPASIDPDVYIQSAGNGETDTLDKRGLFRHIPTIQSKLSMINRPHARLGSGSVLSFE